jgi:uncharacterized protein
MTEVSSYPPGTFCWVELSTNDRQAATEFYTKLFGWTANPMPMGPGPDDVYVMLEKKGKEVGALTTGRDPNVPPNWNNYVSVTSVDDTAEKAKSLGGNVLAPPFDVMDVGRMAVIADPQGGVFSLWQPGKHFGASLVNETGAFCWNELMTNDIEGARKFYTSLFGWTTKVSPEYTELHNGDRPAGGMIDKLPPGAPPHWVPYFAVDDTDATVEQVKSLGGKVYMPGTDIPNVGRFAFFADPQGADFAVIKITMPPG